MVILLPHQALCRPSEYSILQHQASCRPSRCFLQLKHDQSRPRMVILLPHQALCRPSEYSFLPHQILCRPSEYSIPQHQASCRPSRCVLPSKYNQSWPRMVILLPHQALCRPSEYLLLHLPLLLIRCPTPLSVFIREICETLIRATSDPPFSVLSALSVCPLKSCSS